MLNIPLACLAGLLAVAFGGGVAATLWFLAGGFSGRTPKAP